MSNNFYDIQRNSELSNISHSLDGVSRSIKDQTYLQAFGKDAYIQMLEKRRFREQIIWCGVGAFLVGFFVVGLYMNNWNMSELCTRLTEMFMNLF